MSLKTDVAPAKPPPFVAWPLLIGAAGFAAGFFGPIIFIPDSNIGPVIGILMTGPGGAVLGLLMGATAKVIAPPPATAWKILLGTAAIVALSVLAFCIISPNPRLHGRVIEGEIQACLSPDELAPEAIHYWDKRIASVTSAAPRAGWRDGVPQLLVADAGLVLEIKLIRENFVYEERNIWNKGKLNASGWRSPETPTKRFYVRQDAASCSDYQLGSRVQSMPIDESSSDWPPSKAPIFLGLLLMKPVPALIQKQL